MSEEYVPRKGEFVALLLPTSSGHGQRGHRPALVVSNDLFNEQTGMCMVCPVTRTNRQYPFHVEIPDGGEVCGVVMVDQIRSVDFRSRAVKPIADAPAEVLDQALAILDACVY